MTLTCAILSMANSDILPKKQLLQLAAATLPCILLLCIILILISYLLILLKEVDLFSTIVYLVKRMMKQMF